MVYFIMKIIQQPALVKKIVIPQSESMYSSFPTFTEYNNKLFIFYRQGIKNIKKCHGTGGKVKCFEINKEAFLSTFDDNAVKSLYKHGKDRVIFENGNEFDAIVSRLGKDEFSLATRTYINRQMKTYISFSDKPVFKDRCEVKIKGVKWLVFYGKGLKWKEGYVFPAYGCLKGEPVERPFIITTNDFSDFELLSYLPSNINGPVLNESSLIYDGVKYAIFMREETFPRGIWYAQSEDLQKWDSFERFLSFAHAPMAVFNNNELYLSFRDLLSNEKTGISLISPQNSSKILIDTYAGSEYDGGYTDIALIDGNVFVLYYIGNQEGEPYIKCCRLLQI